MSAPDRIWLLDRPSKAWQDFPPDDGQMEWEWQPALASTPAREHAEELLEALRMAVSWLKFDDKYDVLGFDALLSKLDHQNTGETDAD